MWYLIDTYILNWIGLSIYLSGFTIALFSGITIDKIKTDSDTASDGDTIFWLSVLWPLLVILAVVLTPIILVCLAFDEASTSVARSYRKAHKKS